MTAKTSQDALRKRVMALRRKGLSFTKVSRELERRDGTVLTPQRCQQIADPEYKAKRRVWSAA